MAAIQTRTDKGAGMRALECTIGSVKFTVAMQTMAGREIADVTYWVDGQMVGRDDFEATFAFVRAIAGV
jgi:hypothetical protein